jgi:hypothetical protein
MPPASPTVARWELTYRIRRRREELGATSAAIAKALGITSTYWPTIERTWRVLSEDKTRILLDVLDFSGPEKDELLEIRAIASGRGWWSQYISLFNDEQMRLWGLESGAAEIRSFESLMMPGLLQTEEYARALIDADGLFVRKTEVDQRVEVRMRRQERLSGEDPLRLNVVVSQAALMQQIGGPEVLLGQLHRLIDAMEALPTLDLRILPFTSRSGTILGGANFHLIDFDRAQLPTLGWHESAVVGQILEDSTMVRNLVTTFGYAQAQALTRDNSLALMKRLANELGSAE